MTIDELKKLYAISNNLTIEMHNAFPAILHDYETMLSGLRIIAGYQQTVASFAGNDDIARLVLASLKLNEPKAGQEGG